MVSTRLRTDAGDRPGVGDHRCTRGTKTAFSTCFQSLRCTPYHIAQSPPQITPMTSVPVHWREGSSFASTPESADLPLASKHQNFAVHRREQQHVGRPAKVRDRRPEHRRALRRAAQQEQLIHRHVAAHPDEPQRGVRVNASAPLIEEVRVAKRRSTPRRAVGRAQQRQPRERSSAPPVWTTGPHASPRWPARARRPEGRWPRSDAASHRRARPSWRCTAGRPPLASARLPAAPEGHFFLHALNNGPKPGTPHMPD